MQRERQVRQQTPNVMIVTSGTACASRPRKSKGSNNSSNHGGGAAGGSNGGGGGGGLNGGVNGGGGGAGGGGEGEGGGEGGQSIETARLLRSCSFGCSGVVQSLPSRPLPRQGARLGAQAASADEISGHAPGVATVRVEAPVEGAQLVALQVLGKLVLPLAVLASVDAAPFPDDHSLSSRCEVPKMSLPNRVHVRREVPLVKVWHMMVFVAIPGSIHLRVGRAWLNCGHLRGI